MGAFTFRDDDEEEEAMSMSMTAAREGGEEDSGSDGSDMRIFRDDEDKNVSCALLSPSPRGLPACRCQ